MVAIMWRFRVRRSRMLVLQTCAVLFILTCVLRASLPQPEGAVPAVVMSDNTDSDAAAQDPGSDDTQDQLLQLQRLDPEAQTEAQTEAQPDDEREIDPKTQVFFPTVFYPQQLVPRLESHPSFFKRDPRLLPALYLSLINREIAQNGALPADFKLPFNWNMLTDSLSSLMANSFYDEVVKADKLTCTNLKESIPFKGRRFPCEDLSPDDPRDTYGLGILVHANALRYFQDEHLRAAYGAMHRLTSFEPPQKIVFLGVTDEGSLVFPVEPIPDGHQDLKAGKLDLMSLATNIIVEDLVEELTRAEPLDTVLVNGLSSVREMEKLSAAINTVAETFVLKNDAEIDPFEPLDVDRSLFDWNLQAEISKLPTEDPFLELFQQAADPNFKEVKHFGEAALDQKRAESGHYDWRFFNGLTQADPKTHQATIHRMFRSWFKFCHDVGVYSWANHGSLIGFYWSGYTLPYDNDIDVQMPIQSLYKLARAMNNTVVIDMTGRGEAVAELGFRSYYLDANPLFGARTKFTTKNNLIDARFIDVTSGLYIDITGLTSVSSYTNDEPERQQQLLEQFDQVDKAKFVQATMYDQFYDGVIPLADIKSRSRKEYRSNIKEKAERLFEAVKQNFQANVSSAQRPALFDGMVHCRNNHFYQLDEFLPLIPTVFENVRIYIPSNWFKNLIVEYDANVLDIRRYKAYSFVPSMQMWVSQHLCSANPDTEPDFQKDCLEQSSDVRGEYERLQPYIASHRKLFKNLFPFQNAKKEVKDIDETSALKHYDRALAQQLAQEFDGGLLRPEPWVVENLI